MSRYFSVFLCSSKWAHSEQVMMFLDWLATLPDLGSRLTLIAREKIGESQKPWLHGNFRDCRAHLNKRSYETVSLFNEEWGVSGSKLYFCFENAAASPSIKPVTYNNNILTVSFRSDIWSLYQHSSISADLFSKVEALFAGLDCAYGYAGRTEYIIPSRYSQIRGAQTGALRIIDFDYTRYIEGVYQGNYISSEILDKLPSDFCHKLDTHVDGVEWKPVYDSCGVFKGIAIYITKVEASEEQFLQQLLDPVIWKK